jgi:hypothetical protein
MTKDDIHSLSLIAIVGGYWVYHSICLQRIAKKCDVDERWQAWLPFFKDYLVCRVTRQSGWWVLPCSIPYIGYVFGLILYTRIPKFLGITDGSRYLMLIPIVNLGYLGYLAFRTEKEE